jgi:hypothetical protein
MLHTTKRTTRKEQNLPHYYANKDDGISANGNAVTRGTKWSASASLGCEDEVDVKNNDCVSVATEEFSKGWIRLVMPKTTLDAVLLASLLSLLSSHHCCNTPLDPIFEKRRRGKARQRRWRKRGEHIWRRSRRMRKEDANNTIAAGMCIGLEIIANGIGICPAPRTLPGAACHA